MAFGQRHLPLILKICPLSEGCTGISVVRYLNRRWNCNGARKAILPAGTSSSC